MRRFMLITSCFGDIERARNAGDLLGLQVAIVDRLHLALQPAQVEEQLLLRRRWCPIFTSDELRRMYSWIAARIHHMA